MDSDFFVWADAMRALWRLYHRADTADRQILAIIINQVQEMKGNFKEDP